MKRNHLLAYYKRSMSGGKSVVARVLDYLALRAVFFGACFFYFRSLVQNHFLTLFLSAVATAIFWIILHVLYSMRLDSFIRAKRLEVYEQYLSERLMLLSHEEFKAYAKKHLISLGGYEIVGDDISFLGERACLHVTAQPEPMTAGALLPVYHEAKKQGAKRLLVFCAGPVPDSVRQFFRRAGDVSVILFEPDALVRFLSKNREEDEEERIDAILFAQIEQERAQRRDRVKHPFAPGRARRYLIAAGLLLIGSFFTSYSLYYRLMSAACFALCIASAVVSGRRKAKQKPYDEPA